MAVERGEAPQDGLDQVQRHFRNPPGVVQVGPGWRDLVLACHRAVVAEFPEYELLAVKQKWASLAFQAFPRAWERGGNWTDGECERFHALIEVFARRSETVCERCGADGSRRESRWIELVLCDPCESRVPEDGDVLRDGGAVRR
ncbi:hypothetical protein ACFT9I_25635 [Streptomyces sp. NPDC057137]|uniref:hypothetical protein n=1 Tax=Streptomyces sp. NPDC057137 TaxID=3346030 RepID=UPI00363A6125